jgi:hypothetical protein
MGVTAHYIDKDWGLEVTTLDFVNLLGPHTGSNLHKCFVNVLKTYGLETETLGITVDNASNNDAFINFLENHSTIPGTSTSSERLFSSGKHLIADTRESLSPSTIRACQCLKSWEKWVRDLYLYKYFNKGFVFVHICNLADTCTNIYICCGALMYGLNNKYMPIYLD